MAQRLETDGQSFAVVRRGYDPDQVRHMIRSLSAQVESLERKLEVARAALADASSAPPMAIDLDESMLASRLGEEAARVLTTARQGAAEMRARAAEQLERALREAQDDAARIRSEAELEAARRRQEANDEAEHVKAQARQQGREMLAEAHAVRERVLADLSRRREAGRRQLSQLKAGRDRILSAYDVARRALDEVTDELARSVPEAQLLAEGALAAPLVDSADDDDWLRGLDRRDTGEMRILGEVPAPAPHSAPRPFAEVPDEAEAVSLADVEAEVVEPEPEPAVNVVETSDDEPVAAVDDAEVSASASPAGDASLDGAPVADPAPVVEDLFARIRAQRTRDVSAARTLLAEPEVEIDLRTAAPVISITGAGTEPLVRTEFTAEAEVEVEPDVEVDSEVVADPVFARRAAELAPIHTTLSRHLKRTLADEQNEVFDRLRRVSSSPNIDAVLGPELDQLERYRSAAEADLRTAAVAGARSTGVSPLEAARLVEQAKVIDAVLSEVALEIAVPLRSRLVECLAGVDQDSDETTSLLRSAYREWKIQRIEDLSAQVTLSAYERGAVAALPAGTCVRWTIDPTGPKCADAEDNALGGLVVVGEPFPTGHCVPPAHAGCRCHLVVG